jgi:acetyl esterase/lipase
MRVTRSVIGMGTAALIGVAGATWTPPAWSQAPASPPRVTTDPDGTVHVPAVAIPPSAMLSDVARSVLARTRPTEGPGAPVPVPVGNDMAEVRRLYNAALQPNVQHMRDLYPVDIEETTIDGISVAIITPKGGVPEKNKNRLMINAPGGGFRTGVRGNGLLISIPVASVGQMKVVSVLYRQYPEFKYPAATEDFTKVYASMLKTYKPANMGLFGCSAGGVLVTQAVAHFLLNNIPPPAVLGV